MINRLPGDQTGNEKRHEFVPADRPAPIPCVEPDHEHIKSQTKGLIVELLAVMDSNPAYNNPMPLSQLAAAMLMNGMIASLADFDTHLRDMGARVFFIGVALDYFNDGEQTYGCVYPHDKDSAPEFQLYVAVNGQREATQMLNSIGIDAEENCRRLQTTGFLTIEPS